jgi:UDPglucose 6-dehydrogenase
MDPTYVQAASRSIAETLRKKGDYHIVVVKSTVVPGTTKGVIGPILETNGGKHIGLDLGVAMCPEFLREGSAMNDSMHPDRVVIGAMDEKAFIVLEELFGPLKSKVLRTDPTTAEMIKYTSNSFLATKISFANEVSRICEKLGIDIYDVMNGVGMDSRISPQFLRAGAGFGGSCFPKDVSALIRLAGDMGSETPLLDSVMVNNEIQPVHLAQVIEGRLGDLRGKRIGILGLAFKPDTDDIRETRSLPLTKYLLSKGALVRGHDPKASTNFSSVCPEITIEEDLGSIIKWAQVIVLMTEWPEYRSWNWAEQVHLDGVFDGRRTLEPSNMGEVPYWAMGSPL